MLDETIAKRATKANKGITLGLAKRRSFIDNAYNSGKSFRASAAEWRISRTGDVQHNKISGVDDQRDYPDDRAPRDQKRNHTPPPPSSPPTQQQIYYYLLLLSITILKILLYLLYYI